MIIKGALEPEHNITHAIDLECAKKYLLAKEYDLIFLDVMFPNGNGFDFFSTLTELSPNPPPVLFLTSKKEISDQALGYSLGADGYLIKPISKILLQARVTGLLRKTKMLHGKQDLLRSGDLKFVFTKQKAFICSEIEGEQEMDLTSREYKMLVHLCKHEDQVFSREQLLDSIWGDVNISDRTVDSHISHLRKKLTKSICNIESVHGVGYRFVRQPKGRPQP